VEDDSVIASLWRDALGASVQVLQAKTLEEAEKLIAAHGDSLVLAILGGQIMGGDTVCLVPLLKESLAPNFIIAASDDDGLQAAMVAQGCQGVLKQDVAIFLYDFATAPAALALP
jgi:DNA-binding response OmpR family regulator